MLTSRKVDRKPLMPPEPPAEWGKLPPPPEYIVPETPKITPEEWERRILPDIEERIPGYREYRMELHSEGTIHGEFRREPTRLPPGTRRR